ncbi:alpha/beta fold hydrolase [Amycolatopsis sp. cg5]|uniref:alpha/beta fold hydrolase n=1 Tax=Amycolatopsis sp. cg5 TaxID=3238802 RepID=UPI003523F0A4
MPEIAVNGTTLAYDDTGPRTGSTLVFSHSLFFNRTMFAPLVAHFADRYRVITYDHRGQGESAPAALPDLSMDVLTEDAAALIEALDLGRVHFIGNSMGGFVALRLAARRPDLLRSAVALGSSAEEEHQAVHFAPLLAKMRAEGAAPLVDVVTYIMFGDTSLASESPMLAEWRAYFAALPESIADSAHHVIHRDNIVAELASVEVPVLAIAGAEDHTYPPPISSENIASATGGRHVTVAGAGHSVALEQPAEVAAHLEKHLSES